MRISTRYQYDTFQYDARNAQEKLAEISRQLSTGRRINKPSDDPIGVRQTINMRNLRAGMEQYRENLHTAKGALGYTDNTAKDMNDLMREGYQLAIQGASSSTDQNGRNAMAAQISSIQTRLIDLANTRDAAGGYLFSGQRTSVKPYVLIGSTLTFNGDTNSKFVETGPGEQMQTNVSGEPMITEMYNRLESLKSNLMGGQIGALSGVDIANMQASMDTISSVRASIGARLSTVDDLDLQWQRRADELTISISDVEDVDMSEAVVKYQQANQAYTAALTVAGQGFRLSLMDFIQ